VTIPEAKNSELKVAVLLAAFNGQSFITEQIESIRAQGFQNWELYIRDDGSDDTTVSIVKSFATKDCRIHLIEDQQRNLGASGNFSCLMEHVTEMDFSYYCFADQDDVWESNKLELQLEEIHRLEAGDGEAPILIHTDLKVVGEDLSTIHPSYIQQQGVRIPECEPYKLLAVQNYVTGCTVMFNHALFRVVCPIPENVGMHDWWLAFCAASTGKIDYLLERTVLYRQHGDNVVGASGGGLLRNGIAQRWRQGQHEMLNALSMSTELLSRIDTRSLDALPSRPFLEALSRLSAQSFYCRLQTLYRYRVYRSPWFMTLVLYARLLFL